MPFLLKHCSPNRKSRTAGTHCNTPLAFFFSPHFLIHLTLFIFPPILRVMETGRRANCRRSQWNYPCRRSRTEHWLPGWPDLGIDSPADETASQLNSLVLKKKLNVSWYRTFWQPHKGQREANGNFTQYTFSSTRVFSLNFNERPGEIIGFLASVANSKHD